MTRRRPRGWRRSISAAGELALTAVAQRAAEALAIHHEHRVRDLAAARSYAERLRGYADARVAPTVEHRLGRLDRKIERSGKGDARTPQDAWLPDA